MKKIPIHFNTEDLTKIQELAKILKLNNCYGEIPKTIKFSITFTLAALKSYDNVIPDMKPAEMDIFLSSIKELRKEHEKQDLIKKADILVRKV